MIVITGEGMLWAREHPRAGCILVWSICPVGGGCGPLSLIGTWAGGASAFPRTLQGDWGLEPQPCCSRSLVPSLSDRLWSSVVLGKEGGIRGSPEGGAAGAGVPTQWGRSRVTGPCVGFAPRDASRSRAAQSVDQCGRMSHQHQSGPPVWPGCHP